MSFNANNEIVAMMVKFQSLLMKKCLKSIQNALKNSVAFNSSCLNFYLHLNLAQSQSNCLQFCFNRKVAQFLLLCCLNFVENALFCEREIKTFI